MDGDSRAFSPTCLALICFFGAFLCQISLNRVIHCLNLDGTTFHGLQSIWTLGLFYLLDQRHPLILSLICPYITNNYICLWKLFDSIWNTMTGLNEVLYGHNSTLTLNFLAFVDFCHNLNIFQTKNHYIKKINLYFN